MERTVSGERSFEVFKQAILAEDEFLNDAGNGSRQNEETPIFPSDVFPSPNSQDGSFSKRTGTETLNKISPTNVTEFEDGFSHMIFPQLTPNQNEDDQWNDDYASDEFEQQQQPGIHQLNFMTANPILVDGEKDRTRKILFPVDPESNGTNLKNRKTNERSDNWWGSDFDDKQERNDENQLDEHGFPTCSSPSNLSSSSKELFQQHEAPLKDCEAPNVSVVIADQDSINNTSSNRQTPDISIATTGHDPIINRSSNPQTLDTSIVHTDQDSIRNNSSKQHTSPGKDTIGLLSSNHAFRSFRAQNQIAKQAHIHLSSTKNEEDEGCEHTNFNKDTTSKGVQSHWERLMAKLPTGTRVKDNILQVRRKILECHEPREFLFTDDDNIISNEQSNKTSENDKAYKSVVSESVFSSFQRLSTSVVSTSQDMLSIPSDASTPVRKQNNFKSNTNPSCNSFFGNETKDLKSQQSIDGTDKSCDSTLKLCIDHYDQSSFQTLMSNLKENTQVTDLHVFRTWEGDTERSRTAGDIDLLFKTIRSLSNLEKLNLANFFVHEIHFIALSQWRNDNLNTIRIHLCKGTLSKRLLDVLAGLPALKDVILEMNETFPFHILLRSPTLESLTIVANEYTIDNLHAMEVVQMLPKNKTLTKLVIEPPMMLRTFKLLASALSKNIGIEYFKFSLLPGNHADTNRAVCELARTLTTNASLKTIWNLNHSKVHVKDRTCDVVMKSLSENFIIEDFRVFKEDRLFSEKKQKILKDNKGGLDSIIPEVFKCVKDVGDYHCNDGSEENTIAAEEPHTLGEGISSIGDNMKSQAKRVASSALDFVGF